MVKTQGVERVYKESKNKILNHWNQHYYGYVDGENTTKNAMKFIERKQKIAMYI
jgi:hypothetical protein